MGTAGRVTLKAGETAKVPANTPIQALNHGSVLSGCMVPSSVLLRRRSDIEPRADDRAHALRSTDPGPDRTASRAISHGHAEVQLADLVTVTVDP
jgi:hypothetical protein